MSEEEMLTSQIFFFWFSLLFPFKITVTVTDKPLTPYRKLNTPLFKVNKNLRLVDTAVVEDQIHAGELLPCLLRLDIQFYHTLVTYKQLQLVTTSCLTIFLYVVTQLWPCINCVTEHLSFWIFILEVIQLLHFKAFQHQMCKSTWSQFTSKV